METEARLEENRPCFICGKDLGVGEGVFLVKTCINSSKTPIPTMLVKLIGNEFLLMVSIKDKVCSKCLLLLNQIALLESKMNTVKSTVVKYLQIRYDFEIKKEITTAENNDEQWCIIEEVDNEDKKDEVACEVCGNVMERGEMLNHLQTKHGGEDEVSFGDSTAASVSGLGKISSKDTTDAKSEVHHITEDSTCDDLPESEDIFTVEMDDEDDDKYCNYCDISFLTPKEKSKHDIDTHDALMNIKVEVEETGDGDDVMEVIKLNKTEPQEEEANDEAVDNPDYNLIFKCAYCGFTSEDRATVEAHTDEHQANPIFSCNICEMPFPSQNLLSRHLKVHERLKLAVNCKVCNLECHDNLHLQYHTRNCHDVLKRSSCVICMKTFNSSKELKRHVLSFHSGVKNYKCDECSMTFQRHVQFENHKVYVHGNKHCKICGKRIEDAQKLRQHEKRHARTDIIKFECEDCGRIFKTPGGLRIHKVSHTGNYKFFCEFCGKGFMSAFIMEEHKGVHTKEERYICDLCGRKFVLHSTFHLHKQWHKDPFPFPCKYCGKKFKYRSERANHNRREHTGELPHQCSYCSAKFLKAVHLKKHLIVHTKEYPFVCKICEMGFDEKRAYGRHLARVHKDSSMVTNAPKKCEYKVILRPDEFQEVVKNQTVSNSS